MATSVLSKTKPLPENEIIYDRDNATKLVISYESDDEDEIFKVVKEYRIEKVRVSAAVAKRKSWKKYGESKSDPPGPNPANTYPGEVVTIQYIRNKLTEETNRMDEETKPSARVQTVTCRICKGAHFSHACPNKSDMEAILELQSKLGGDLDADDKNKAPLPVIDAGTSGRYVPPTLRAGNAAAVAAAAPSGMPERRRLDGFSIRVTNLPDNTREEDLREIFTKFGNVIRVFPVKDKKTQMNRGFAYISYLTYEEAADAIFAADNMRYGHLILKVDWAQPSNN